MPWKTDSDVQKHNKKLSKPQMKKWRSIANGVYKQCLKDGGDDKSCAPKSIKVANSSVEKNGKRIK